MIPVTKPFLPPKEEYDTLVQQIWERNWLTNNGPLINQLELKLKDRLKVDHLLVVLNGTIALQLAFKALGLKGKYLSTPFSYVATVSAAVWEGLEPRFVDIDPDSFNIDPDKIEEAIDDDVCCIVATHVFGNPCDVERLQEVGAKHGLPVIYDAAHAFGVTVGGKGIAEFGDISTFSFHATKLYHMVEGGAVVAQDPDIIKSIAFSRNFGHNGEHFEGVGINGKNSEFHSAMGLVNLRHIDEIIARRKLLYLQYLSAFEKSGISFCKQRLLDEAGYNFAYFPIVFDTEDDLLIVKKALEDNYVQPRRYFYPSLNLLPYTPPQTTPNSESIAKRILCLPLYNQLTLEEVDYISRLVIRALRYS